MDTPESGNKFVAYVRANRAFFVFLAVIVLSVFGYFWWRSGFTLEFSKFFAYCDPDSGCSTHMVCVSQSCQQRPDPNDEGDQCSGDQDCGGGPACTADCGSGDCDGDCALNPAVAGGNDCDDGNPNVQGNCPLALCGVDPACQGNENQNNCPQDCGSPGPVCGDGNCEGNENQNNCSQDCGSPANTCETNGNVCIANYPGGGCPPGTVSASGNCNGAGACCRQGSSGQPPQQPNLSASPGSVPPGGTVNLSWNSSNATACRVLAGNFGPIDTNGTASEVISGSATQGQVIGFRIACSNAYGETQSNVAEVTISGAPVTQHVECDPVQALCKLRDGAGANAPDCSMNTIDQPCQVARHLACVNASCASVEGGGGNRDGCNTLGQGCQNPSGQGICAGYPDRWGDNGVVVCRISSNFVNDRCTIAGPGQTMTYTLGIYNGSNQSIYSKPAIFGCPWATCGAIDNNSSNPPNWPQGSCGFGNASLNRSGASNLGIGDSGTVTYEFQVPDCGSIQFDDTWGPGNFVFVIGNVVNSDNDCPVTASHNVCQNNACVSVNGAGANQCSSAADCAPAANHTVCQNNACVSVAGGGANQCSSAADCATPTHLACVSNACVPVAGGGANQCASTADCAPQAHNICQNNACVSTAGPGANQCATAADCQPATHTVCTNNACSRVTGAGTNECATNTDCQPIPPLRCLGMVTQAAIGQAVPFSASGGTGSYSWYGPGGTPPTGGGASYQITYSVPGFKTVTVASGGQQATCTVTILAPQTSTPPPTTTVVPTCTPAVCPAPPDGCTYQSGTTCTCGTLVCPSNAPLVCAPVSQEVAIGQTANFVVGGGTVRTYSWTATGGNPPSAAGPSQSFSTRYSAAGTYRVTVSGGGQTATCNVLVRETTPPPTTITPPPTSPAITITKTVRNVTANGPNTESANADPGHTVEFTITVSSVGNGTARDVTVRDSLPAGLNYQAGTTRVDGSVAADGITGSGILLGDMPSGRTIVVRFRAIIADPAFFTNGTTTLVNTAFARGSNTGEVSDTAQVVVTRGQGLAMSITKLGRNVTRGESGEHSPVQSSPGQTIEFFIHVRNTSNATLTNVVVRDVLPERITFIPGTVRLNGQPAADSLVTSGVPIGNLNAGAEAVITFSGRVAADAEFAPGSVTLINTAQATADSVPMVQAQLPVIVTKGAVVTVPTGPGESTLLALIISALITLLYVGYTSTESFRRREAAGLAGHAHDDKGLFDFKR